MRLGILTIQIHAGNRSNEKVDAEALAEQHWLYTAGLLNITKNEKPTIREHYLYKQAFIHGYKHGVNSI